LEKSWLRNERSIHSGRFSYPYWKINGVLKDIRPDDLGAVVIKALIYRNPSFSAEQIEEVALGNVGGVSGKKISYHAYNEKTVEIYTLISNEKRKSE